MPGPPPKDPKIRQRTNRKPGAGQLPPEKPASRAAKRNVPAMPDKKGGWTEEAKEAWQDLFLSPMREKFLRADLARQRIYIDAIDRYWRGDTALMNAIRLEGENFGTSPMARCRLQWEVRDGQEDAAEPVAVGDGRPAPKKAAVDPRKVLRGDFK